LARLICVTASLPHKLKRAYSSLSHARSADTALASVVPVRAWFFTSQVHPSGSAATVGPCSESTPVSSGSWFDFVPSAESERDFVLLVDLAYAGA
jgi:hypothetical protein